MPGAQLPILWQWVRAALSCCVWALGRVQAGSGGAGAAFSPSLVTESRSCPCAYGQPGLQLLPRTGWNQLSSSNCLSLPAQSVWIVCSFPKFKCASAAFQSSLRTWSLGVQSSSGFSQHCPGISPPLPSLEADLQHG